MNIGNDHRKVQILLDSKPNDRFWPFSATQIPPINQIERQQATL